MTHPKKKRAGDIEITLKGKGVGDELNIIDFAKTLLDIDGVFKAAAAQQGLDPKKFNLRIKSIKKT